MTWPEASVLIVGLLMAGFVAAAFAARKGKK